MKSIHLAAVVVALMVGWGVYSLLTPSVEAPHAEQTASLPPCEETAAGCPENTAPSETIGEEEPPEATPPSEEVLHGDVGMEFPVPDEEMIACTMDAMQCPDGSYVGRQGPHCEFAPCPGE